MFNFYEEYINNKCIFYHFLDGFINENSGYDYNSVKKFILKNEVLTEYCTYITLCKFFVDISNQSVYFNYFNYDDDNDCFESIFIYKVCLSSIYSINVYYIFIKYIQ